MTSQLAIVLILHAFMASVTALHAMMYKRDPRAAIGWIGVCLLLPLAGPILYLLFGLNRARDKAQHLGKRSPPVAFERGQAPRAAAELPAQMPTAFPNLARVGTALSRHDLVAGNAVTALVNGEQAYPAMLEAIDQAKHQLLFSTYLLDMDTTGSKFIDSLAAAARRGVETRVLIDGIGDWYSWPRASRRLAEAGVNVARFLPPRLLPPNLAIHMRNHHKLLAIDNSVAFTGGMNIGDRHCISLADNPRPTADVHFQVSGPVVDQLSTEFQRLWRFCTGQACPLPGHHAGAADGELLCRALADGPDADLDRLTVLLGAALAEARESVLIMTPYFLPPRELIGALQAAAIRGIRVLLVLPLINNLPYVHWATRNMLWEVLLHGVRVVYQVEPFNHAKLFVVDGRYSLVGSANWDARSLRLNFELQLEVYGEKFAADLTNYIEQAAAGGREVTLTEVDHRSLPVRARDAFCWLFTPYL
ncbi:MAG: phospholipase D-like domain-containing protein [Wenzhouxiangella sp.]|nr:phospholipase D-like domain-containing protein [Wenzhouxiangella sp.]